MILRPVDPPTRGGGGFLPAWPVIEAAQRRAGSDCWLITQADHAKLSGEIAAAMSAPEFPALDAEVVAGIALHDAGWAQFDEASFAPISFADAPPAQIGAAWLGSIETAAQSSPVAGYMVSRHFQRIAQSDLAAQKPEAQLMLAQFAADEERRQRELRERQDFTREELEEFTDVLQFCDLLSLYLCCGAGDDIEFPQRFGGQAVRLRGGPESGSVEPTPFAGEQRFWVRGRRAASGEEAVFAFALR